MACGTSCHYFTISILSRILVYAALHVGQPPTDLNRHLLILFSRGYLIYSCPLWCLFTWVWGRLIWRCSHSFSHRVCSFVNFFPSKVVRKLLKLHEGNDENWSLFLHQHSWKMGINFLYPMVCSVECYSSLHYVTQSRDILLRLHASLNKPCLK